MQTATTMPNTDAILWQQPEDTEHAKANIEGPRPRGSVVDVPDQGRMAPPFLCAPVVSVKEIS